MGTKSERPKGESRHRGPFFRLENGLSGDVAGGGVSELRAWISRLFPAAQTRDLILFCGGTKSTQDRDIREAKQLAKDWMERDD